MPVLPRYVSFIYASSSSYNAMGYLKTRASRSTHIIRMCNHKGHAAFFGNPIKFLLPNVDIFLLHENEECEILRKRIG